MIKAKNKIIIATINFLSKFVEYKLYKPQDIHTLQRQVIPAVKSSLEEIKDRLASLEDGDYWLCKYEDDYYLGFKETDSELVLQQYTQIRNDKSRRV